MVILQGQRGGKREEDGVTEKDPPPLPGWKLETRPHLAD